jgi:hypothetical protein
MARKSIAQMPGDIREAIVSSLRNAAKETVNGLASAGPDWSGDFKNTWHVTTSDGKSSAKIGGESGVYNLFNIPLLKTQSRNLGGRFTTFLPTKLDGLELLIGNSSFYATQAMDLEPGEFFYPGFEPKGQEEPRGRRVNRIRGNLKKPGANRSTAPFNWYATYMEGGAFAAAFTKGARAGFASSNKNGGLGKATQ